MKRNTYSIFSIVMIVLSLLLIFSSCISWLYGLHTYFPAKKVNLVSEGIGYSFQAVGLFLFVVFIKKTPDFMLKRMVFTVFLCGDLFFVALALTAKPWRLS